MANYSQWFKRLCGMSSRQSVTKFRTRPIRFEALEERRLLTAAPDDFRAINNGDTEVRLEWADTNLGETGYEIERSINGIDQWEGDFAIDPGPNDIQLDVESFRSYYFRIRSIGHPGGPSDWTDPSDPLDGSPRPASGRCRPTCFTAKWMSRLPPAI